VSRKRKRKKNRTHLGLPRRGFLGCTSAWPLGVLPAGGLATGVAGLPGRAAGPQAARSSACLGARPQAGAHARTAAALLCVACCSRLIV